MKIVNTFDTTGAAAKVKFAIKLYATAEAKRLEGYAKSDAIWVDRTSNARNSINGSFKWKGNKAMIVLSGNMEYSVYLELAMEKRYAVLVPTIIKNQTEILNGFRKLVK